MQKIMIIDDEIDILYMLERYFRLNGYIVITADGAEAALKKLNEQPDIILLDINMPGMNGISFCRNIRDFVTCPILFLTANTDDKDKIKGFGAGGDDYIVKPFSIDELGARVCAHLRRENRKKARTKIMFDTYFVIDYSQRAVFYQAKVAEKYTSEAAHYNTEKVWDKDYNVYLLSEDDSQKMCRLEWFKFIFPHTCYICATFLASWIFYRMKLKKPLRILSAATNRIANNDLQHKICYEREDEFGQLCKAFEKMRSSLCENNHENWRQIEERKRLNASFSHDLRTPLTVLEGHLDILKKYTASGQLSQDDITEIYSVMDIQLKRLNRYVSSMNQLQRLEDVQISVKTINSEDLIKALKNTADIICQTKKLSFSDEIKAKTVNVDMEIVMQVFENLLSNAMRYANATIEVVCKRKGRFFVIVVSDDGIGFDTEAIKIATDPFYTTEKKSEGQHFGLGLNISKILCQRHGGGISLKNVKSGGASVTVTFATKSV